MNWIQRLFSKNKKEEKVMGSNDTEFHDCPERGSASLDNPISNQWGYYGDTENDNSFDRAINPDTEIKNKTDIKK